MYVIIHFNSRETPQFYSVQRAVLVLQNGRANLVDPKLSGQKLQFLVVKMMKLKDRILLNAFPYGYLTSMLVFVQEKSPSSMRHKLLQT